MHMFDLHNESSTKGPYVKLDSIMLVSRSYYLLEMFTAKYEYALVKLMEHVYLKGLEGDMHQFVASLN